VAGFSPDAACEDVLLALTNTSQSAAGISSSFWTINGSSLNINSTDINPLVSFPDQGMYSVGLSVADGNGCKDTLQKDIQVFPPISASFTTDKTTLCAGEKVSFSNNSAGIIDQFIWIYGDGSPNGSVNDTTHTYQQAGSYIVQLIAINNTCGNDTSRTTITVTPLPALDISGDKLSICSGDTAAILVTMTGTPDSLVWNTGETGQSIDITNPGTYTVTAYKDGCSNKDSIVVNTFCLIFVPTAFSPNGDGKNETFNVVDKNIESYTLTIYNRWNEKLFSTSDVRVGWDGRYKGVESPVDAYIYHLSGIKTDGTPFDQKGVVSLFR
jgi:gliding motility-associated-like protein